MLDNETRRRIDTARDILVGKVPDPKSQVEQITIALIYKFMDDMDKEAEELGGAPGFFTGEFEKYGWSKIFDPRLGGYELIGLYSDAIVKMNLNPNIPQLFRDIFKNAYLPYRDPETLKSFLKEINQFSYDHSERLGDAFEYLLSVLGSQGDAGQFRTPRHIIDFIVAAVDPQKQETILDPACGTAGFLISSYKHILGRNRKERPGDLLTPDERSRLLNNFVGYDISPDMVRLSLVNMYLHNFNDPHIYEYDTLTSEERWNEYYDVIMANPPFMSPKGGIRPHKRFSVPATRSEVLFVDYIMEHLTPAGRAGVIVPEGIIFQSGSAYKSLRKMLLENGYLYAVVSLPAGVFNPYSGVKTSILLLDRALAKKTANILFLKIENDGFSLGAQRTPVDKNDLPRALEMIRQYKQSLQNDESFDIADEEKKYGLLASKEEVAESGNYNLSGDRYRVDFVLKHEKWPVVELQEICERITDGTHYTPRYEKEGIIFLSSKNVKFQRIDWKDIKYISPELHKELSKRVSPKLNDILLAKNGTTGVAALVDQDIVFDIYVSLALLRTKENILPKYLLYLINSQFVKNQFNARLQGIGVPNLHLREIKEVKIPLPPLEVQEQIVAEIEGYQKIIDGARQIVENYKPQIKIDPAWEMVELGAVTKIKGGYAFNSYDFSEKKSVKSIKITNVGVGEFVETNNDYLPEEFLVKYAEYKVKSGDIVIALTRSVISTGLKVCLVPDTYDSALVNQRVAFIQEIPDVADIRYVYIYLASQLSLNYILEKSKSLMQPNLSTRDLSTFKIPLPSYEVQKQIVAEIEEEQKLIDANKRLMELFEQKIKDKIAGVWGE